MYFPIYPPLLRWPSPQLDGAPGAANCPRADRHKQVSVLQPGLDLFGSLAIHSFSFGVVLQVVSLGSETPMTIFVKVPILEVIS